MKNEMEILGMTEKEEVCWLKANRITLMIVGAVWIGMIVQQFLTDRTPWFLIIMVPVFALIRFTMYRYYKRVMIK